ncbi:carbonic anhydrase [Neohortaea acidophila]|uniref:Carbonic anhydrase n=1 Tax=Neohortaea acidophila TaxID=245834 RepID=A0A6A6PH85_9PEZI|nr:carbonic anhydrase [Neohortaea acidophila]KAF2479362.1 carbonic anhydrase [Neohortaea acidophila]
MASSTSQSAIAPFLDGNKKWAQSFAESDGDLLSKFPTWQAPPILWLGCSDSRQPETTILGAKPGTCFVHRNIANVITATDLSATAVIEYAVNALQVKHIILCGHTGCGGCKASLGNAKVGKIDTWLMPLRQLRLKHAAELQALEWEQRWTRFSELNVMNGVEVLRQNPDVIAAIKSRGLTVHGVIYDLGTGVLKELDIPVKDDENRAWAFETA